MRGSGAYEPGTDIVYLNNRLRRIQQERGRGTQRHKLRDRIIRCRNRTGARAREMVGRNRQSVLPLDRTDTVRSLLCLASKGTVNRRIRLSRTTWAGLQLPINAFENMKKQLPSKWFGGDPTWMAIPDSAAVYGPIRHRQPVRSARREGKLTRDLPENVSIAGP